VFILPLHLDYTKVIILILWWRNFQLEYWRTFQLVSTSKYIASHAESVISLPKGHMKRNESYLYTLQINLHEIKIEEAKVENWSDITNDVTIE
ncbi:hypothetical protein DW046_15830, partial [Bacteroides stercoris]